MFSNPIIYSLLFDLHNSSLFSVLYFFHPNKRKLQKINVKPHPLPSTDIFFFYI
jgi:hypothetical protein